MGSGIYNGNMQRKSFGSNQIEKKISCSPDPTTDSEKNHDFFWPIKTTFAALVHQQKSDWLKKSGFAISRLAVG